MLGWDVLTGQDVMDLFFFLTTEAEVALAEQRYPAFPYEIDKAIPEVVHRYFAAALGLLAIFIVYLTHRTEDKQTKEFQFFYLIFICCQGLFGYLTVSLKLLPIIVTTHLFGGFITLSTFFYLYIKNSNFFKNFQIGHLKNLAMLALFVLVIQIFLGAWTSTNYASLACPDFPTCHGKWLLQRIMQKVLISFSKLDPITLEDRWMWNPE